MTFGSWHSPPITWASGGRSYMRIASTANPPPPKKPSTLLTFALIFSPWIAGLIASVFGWVPPAWSAFIYIPVTAILLFIGFYRLFEESSR